ncbi:MAG: hypothetical protein ACJARL_002045 [Halopseudomonas sp.]|jgi:hypothetical protein
MTELSLCTTEDCQSRIQLRADNRWIKQSEADGATAKQTLSQQGGRIGIKNARRQAQAQITELTSFKVKIEP